MRHRKAGRKLQRTASHRKAMLSNLSTSVLRHKKVKTTLAKAKEVRLMVEKLITRAKNTLGSENPQVGVHARRMVGRYIKDRAVMTELFSEIAPKVASRPGGYTRVIKLGQRWGDGGEVAIVELVDYNTGQSPAKKTTEKPKAKKVKVAKETEVTSS